MNELALFAGAGGGILGSKLLGHRIIGYVENNDYRQQIIAQRIKDGIFDDAPIFGDIKAFNSDGYAKSYQGLVDVVSGGFPCQDLSCAGKGAGITGERSGLWFEMASTVRIVRPRYVFIENVPMLLVRGFEHVLRSLSQMGYDAAWGIVSAADVGAPHLRKRLWILAKSGCRRCCKSEKWKIEQQGRTKIERSSKNMADTQKQSIRSGLCKDEQAEVWRGRSSNGGCSVSNTDSCGKWWSTERGLDRVVNGLANRVERIASIGDGQVPIVAAFAFECLKKIIEDGI